MTDDMMALRELVAKNSDADVLREMIGFAAQRLTELEVAEHTGGGSCPETWCRSEGAASSRAKAVPMKAETTRRACRRDA